MDANFVLIIIGLWLALISLISIVVTALDKIKAITHKWRVKESTLLILSALGGSVAMYITMHIIRHKTRKLKFMLGIPLIFVLQLALAIFVFMVMKNAVG